MAPKIEWFSSLADLLSGKPSIQKVRASKRPGVETESLISARERRSEEDESKLSERTKENIHLGLLHKEPMVIVGVKIEEVTKFIEKESKQLGVKVEKLSLGDFIEAQASLSNRKTERCVILIEEIDDINSDVFSFSSGKLLGARSFLEGSDLYRQLNIVFVSANDAELSYHSVLRNSFRLIHAKL